MPETKYLYDCELLRKEKIEAVQKFCSVTDNVSAYSCVVEINLKLKLTILRLTLGFIWSNIYFSF